MIKKLLLIASFVLLSISAQGQQENKKEHTHDEKEHESAKKDPNHPHWKKAHASEKPKKKNPKKDPDPSKKSKATKEND